MITNELYYEYREINNSEMNNIIKVGYQNIKIMLKKYIKIKEQFDKNYEYLEIVQETDLFSIKNLDFLTHLSFVILNILNKNQKLLNQNGFLLENSVYFFTKHSELLLFFDFNKDLLDENLYLDFVEQKTDFLSQISDISYQNKEILDQNKYLHKKLKNIKDKLDIIEEESRK